MLANYVTSKDHAAGKGYFIMTLNPQTQAIIEAIEAAEAAGRPKIETLSPKDARQMFIDSREAVAPDPQEVALARDIMVPGPGGDIRVRYYRPQGSEEGERLPVLIYFHGGGWVIGDIDTHDVICRMAANEGRFAVFNVDYRLAPEHKYPAALDDAYAVLEWTCHGAAGMAIDKSRIAIGGDSAGGTLSATCALMARDAGYDIAFQALIYPATNMNRDTDSHQRFADGYLLTTASQNWFHDHYFNNEAEKTGWRASPILADDLSGLPPAFVLTCGYDPLRDEGKAYAERLVEAGVPVIHHRYDGQIHGFITMGKVIDEANQAVAEMALHVKEFFDQLADR